MSRRNSYLFAGIENCAMSGGWQRSNRAARLPKDWAAIRRRILDRDGHQCTWHNQGLRCTAVATEVHHEGDADNHDDSNLRSLCHPHHARITSAEANAHRHKATMRRPPEKHPGIR